MRRRRTMQLIAAALLTSLAGCASDLLTKPVTTATAAQAADAKVQRQAAMSRICPTPTSNDKAVKIAGYLETAAPAPGLDTLATEWERLDDGSRVCRTGKAH